MRKLLYIILLVVCSIILSMGGFRLFYQPKSMPNTQKILLARVAEHYLYKEDIPGFIMDNNSIDPMLTENHEKWLKRYVKQWVTEKLLQCKAQEKVVGEQRKGIEEKVSDFRDSLLVHVYLQDLMDQHLQLEVSEEEILTYYQANAENFKLKENIFRGKLVIIPKNATNIEQVKYLLKQGDSINIEDLQTYCAQNATYYLLDNVHWYNWHELMEQINGSKTLHYALEKIQSLKKPYLKEIQDYLSYYYLQVDDYRSVNDVAPIELVKEQIHKIILHNRKIHLLNATRDRTFEEAKSNQDYTIYDDQNKS